MVVRDSYPNANQPTWNGTGFNRNDRGDEMTRLATRKNLSKHSYDTTDGNTRITPVRAHMGGISLLHVRLGYPRHFLASTWLLLFYMDGSGVSA